MMINEEPLNDEFLRLAENAVVADRELRRRLDAFNVLTVCGVDHYENRHSQILNTFLDPHGSHGFGSLFLEEFFKVAHVDFKVTDKTCSVTEVSTEYGRLDICIKDEIENWCVVIENKVYAQEQQNQLARYGKYLEHYGDRARLLFLTRTGYESCTCNKAQDYTRISYSQEILKWLDRCILKVTSNRIVGDFLKQYKTHIMKITENTMDTKERKSLKDLAQKEFVRFQQLCDRYDAIVSIRQEVIGDFQRRIMGDVAEMIKESCTLEEGGYLDESCVNENTGFSFVINSTKVKVRVSAEARNCDEIFVGVRKDEAKGYWKIISAKCSTWRQDHVWWVWKNCTVAKTWDAGFYQRCHSEKGFRMKVAKEIAQLVREIASAVISK